MAAKTQSYIKVLKPNLFKNTFSVELFGLTTAYCLHLLLRVL